MGVFFPQFRLKVCCPSCAKMTATKEPQATLASFLSMFFLPIPICPKPPRDWVYCIYCGLVIYPCILHERLVIRPMSVWLARATPRLSRVWFTQRCFKGNLVRIFSLSNTHRFPLGDNGKRREGPVAKWTTVATNRNGLALVFIILSVADKSV